MRTFYRTVAIALLAGLSMVSAVQQVSAHLMVAQHGTLNIVGDGIFMVLSLPVSAFGGIDDDSDGHVSMIEFNNHRGAIVESVRQLVVLSDGLKNVSLQDIMLSPVAPHDPTGGQVAQLVVMGRFTLSSPGSALLHIGLYGTQAGEQALEITATRIADRQKAVFVLTPSQPAAVLFPDEA